VEEELKKQLAQQKKRLEASHQKELEHLCAKQQKKDEEHG
jgi:hypothetical protein